MTSAQAAPIRRGVQPRSVVGPENPKPGRDGMTRWKAMSAGSAPCARGSVSGPITSRNSATEPVQPSAQIVKVGLRDLDAERAHVSHSRLLLIESTINLYRYRR